HSTRSGSSEPAPRRRAAAASTRTGTRDTRPSRTVPRRSSFDRVRAGLSRSRAGRRSGSGSGRPPPADLGPSSALFGPYDKRTPARRPQLLANILGQRLSIMPLAVLLVALFAVLAGYPTRMVVGTALAGAGVLIVALANVLLLPLTVELRNAGLALVDFTKQAVGLVGVALLVALGARLTPFFAVQLIVGLVVVSLVPVLTGARAFPLPRLDREEQ